MKRQARAASTFLLALLALAMLPTGAQAATTTSHPYLFSFDGSATAEGEFVGGAGVAVHQATGTVYVVGSASGIGPPGTAESTNQVSVFDSAGNLIRQNPFPATEPYETRIGTVAVDNSGGATDGYVYVSDWGFPVDDPNHDEGGVHVYDPDGNHVRLIRGMATPAGRFRVITSVAVDHLGVVYVATDRDSSVHKFTSNGFHIATYQDSTHLKNPGYVRVDPAGYIYVRTYSDGRFQVAKLSPSGSFVEYLDDELVSFDGSTGDVYARPIQAAAPYLVQRSSGGALISRFGSAWVGDRPKDVAFDGANDRVYVLTTNPSGEHVVRVFGPEESVTVADAGLDPVTTSSYFTATVSGTVNPQGVPTEYHFEYRRTNGVGGWKKTPTQPAGSGSEDIEVSADLSGLQNGAEHEVRLVVRNTVADAANLSARETFTTVAVPLPVPVMAAPSAITASSVQIDGSVDPEGFGTEWRIEVGDQEASGSFGDVDGPQPVSATIAGLAPNTTYTAKLIATNPGGTVTATRTFTTAPLAPEVVTRFAAPRTQTTARLNALVNPRNSETKYWFEYGKTDAYGTIVPISQDGDAGDGNTSLLVSREISGLEPDTNYHFRVVADNGIEAGSGDTEVEGEDATFRTRSASETGPADRGIELVSNPSKGNQAPAAFDFSVDEDKVVWGVNGGAPGSPSGARGAFLAERTPNGWKSKSVLPSLDRLPGGGTQRFTLVTRSADLSRYLFLGASGLLAPSDFSLFHVDLGGFEKVLAPIEDNSVNVLKSVSSTDDLGHIFIATDQRYHANHAADTDNLYDFSTEPPTLVSRLAGSGQPPACGIAALRSTGVAGNFAYGDYAWSSTVDTGAVRAFFQGRVGDCEGGILQIYARDLAQPGAELISGPPLSGPDEGAVFARANPAGNEALFFTATRLDPDDTNSNTDIYKWTAGEGNECMTCVVPDADVVQSETSGIMLAAPDDLSRIYFVSARSLVPGVSVPGRKLYVLKGGEIRFIAPIGESDASVFMFGGLSDDGRRLVFRAAAPGITTDADGEARQLYRYDESSGSVECVSCPRTASLPTLVEPPELLGGSNPVATGDGRSVVFQTSGRLLSADINNSDDVYEWSEGKLRLVTDGETVFSSGSGRLFLHGISRDGVNILFKVGAKLTGHEVDPMPQLYVAHRGGGFPAPPAPPAPCDGDSCQGQLAPAPPLGSSASSTFTGPGNQAKAKQKKGSKPKRRRCAKPRRGKNGKKAGKSATHKGAKCKQGRSAKRNGRAGR